MFLCKVCKFQGQCYHKLKRSCLRRGALFQDPFFPPSADEQIYPGDSCDSKCGCTVSSIRDMFN
uniref:Uncharacterized protein n=1 Tax=Sinocyclocheilus anshuiensis TaxID=1608454 RepID=A0A671PAX2_9TELE